MTDPTPEQAHAALDTWLNEARGFRDFPLAELRVLADDWKLRSESHTQPGVEGDEPTHPGSFWHCEQPVCAKSRAQHEAAADIQDLTAELFADETTGSGAS